MKVVTGAVLLWRFSGNVTVSGTNVGSGISDIPFCGLLTSKPSNLRVKSTADCLFRDDAMEDGNGQMS